MLYADDTNFIPAYLNSDRGASLISSELKECLTTHGIASSCSSAYNPRGKGQVKKYDGIIQKTESLALKDLDLHVKHSEALRSLLCTAINTTPHELMSKHFRRSHYSDSVPSWLSLPGPVLLRNHNWSSNYNPLVEEVTNLGYAHVRFSDGNVKTVSIRNLAPAPESVEVNVQTEDSLHKEDSGSIDGQISNTLVEVTATDPPQETLTPHCDKSPSSAVSSYADVFTRL